MYCIFIYVSMDECHFNLLMIFRNKIKKKKKNKNKKNKKRKPEMEYAAFVSSLTVYNQMNLSTRIR